jgi:DNA-binding GntR family transcriptional regulator
MEGFSGSNIHDNNITNQVREQLRRGILGSEFEVGEKINISSLSLQWNVSKTPIREALRSLEEERLVSYHPRKGYFVLALETDEIKDLIELRMVLESYALQKGFDRIDREKLTKLFADYEREYEAFRKSEPNRYISIDYQFHMEIIQSSGNQRIVELYKSLKSSTDLIRVAMGEDVGATMPEHRQLKEAIMKGDFEDAMAKLRMIFENIEKQFVPGIGRNGRVQSP